MEGRIKKALSAFDLAAQTVCFTGTLSTITRKEAEQLVLQKGGRVSSKVSSKTTLLVIGIDAGSKLDEAREYGIDIIGEDDFLTIAGVERAVKPNTFEFDAQTRARLEELIDENELGIEHQILIEAFVKANAVPCYHIEAVEGEPSPLDSHTGGVPYCPKGVTLPDMPLLIQLNFEGVNLPNYPSKGIMQIFSNNDDMDFGTGDILRYYPDVSDDYRTDIEPSDCEFVEKHKLCLVRGWSIFDLLYSSYQEDFESERKTEARLLSKMRELEDDEYAQGCAMVLSELFKKRSNIGGYAGATPQGQWQFPKDVLLYLECDILDWGDGGAAYYYYEDITKAEKDAELEAYGDMC